MPRISRALLACAGLVVGAAACSAPQPAPPPEQPEAPARELWPAPPADSPLARVQAGMSQQQVMEILGPPARITNASRIAAPETRHSTRTYYVYEGLGEVVFSSGAGATAALGVYYDPDAGSGTGGS